MNKKQILEERIRSKARNNKISCSILRRIAEETGNSYRAAGKMADKLKIKIKNCDLGCF